ncbi:MAG: hypothetical protein NE328_23815 [Lentisphaeraceae bacterium]|nr:hypothetical protein [Lentisphaeraceae bacterium]
MKEIICSNCKESFSVSDEHYQSKKMVFNCNHCRVEIKRNEESGEWQATESLPVPERVSNVDEPAREVSFQKPVTLIEFVKVWRDRVVMIGWFVAGYFFVLLWLVDKVDAFSFSAIVFNILKSLFIAYFVGFLLECLAKHLEHQQEMIKLLKNKG